MRVYMAEKYLAQRRLRDGSVLRLKVYGDGDVFYQLNLVDGIITSQFPTTENLGDLA